MNYRIYYVRNSESNFIRKFNINRNIIVVIFQKYLLIFVILNIQNLITYIDIC